MNFTLTRKQVTEAVYEAEVGFDDAIEEVLRFDYSGRAMYGGQCFGLIATGFGEVYKVLRQFERAGLMDEYEVERLAERMQEDSMGLGRIFYFPNLQISDANAEDLYDQMVAAGHDVAEFEGDDFAVRSYAESVGFVAR